MDLRKYRTTDEGLIEPLFGYSSSNQIVADLFFD